MPQQLLGYPLPNFPQSLLESTKSGMDFLKQPSSVHAYAAVEEKLAAKDKDTPSDKAKGYLQRQYKKFVDDTKLGPIKSAKSLGNKCAESLLKKLKTLE